MIKYFKYLHYLLKHKWYVFLACVQLGITWRGITHDLSKFHFDEWFPYANYFYTEKTQEKKDAFLNSFRLHTKRNSHHWQYWCDKHLLNPTDIDYNSIREMLADWIAMGKNSGSLSVIDWYEQNKNKLVFTERTRRTMETLLYLYMKNKGNN